MIALVARMLLAVLLPLLAGCGILKPSMQQAYCDLPTVRGAFAPAAYVVMLPVSYVGPAPVTPAAENAIATLHLLSESEAIRMAADTRDVHVTQLREREPTKPCNIEEIYAAYADGGALSRRVFSTVVFYWADVSAQGQDVVVQANVRVLWKDLRARSIAVDPSRPGAVPARSPQKGDTFVFGGELPYTTISFPPRKVPPAADLHALKGWTSPAKTVEKPIPTLFRIQSRKGTWAELLDLNDQSSMVWVEVGAPGQASSSAPVIPELSFANALAAYASYRKYSALNADVADDVVSRFEEFRRVYAAERNPELKASLAIADVVEGVLELSRADPAGSRRRRAAELLNRALSVAPSDSSVLNLSAMAEIAAGCCTSRVHASRVQKQLELARQLNAGDVQIARNLMSWYGFVQTQSDEVLPESRASIVERTEDLRSKLCAAGVCPDTRQASSTPVRFESGGRP